MIAFKSFIIGNVLDQKRVLDSMWRITLPIVSLFLPLEAQTPTQTGATITGAGYQAPRPVLVAPGQVVHLRVHGLTTVFNSVISKPGPPLDDFLYGMSVTSADGRYAAGSSASARCGGIATCTASVPDEHVAVLPIPCSSDNSYDIWLQIPFRFGSQRSGKRPECPAAGAIPTTRSHD